MVNPRHFDSPLVEVRRWMREGNYGPLAKRAHENPTIVAMAEAVGLRFDKTLRYGPHGLMSDGVIYSKFMSELHGLHEIAHYVVAPQERSHLPNVGLGFDFSHEQEGERHVDLILSEPVVPRDEADKEEAMAVALSTTWFRELGLVRSFELFDLVATMEEWNAYRYGEERTKNLLIWLSRAVVRLNEKPYATALNAILETNRSA